LILALRWELVCPRLPLFFAQSLVIAGGFLPKACHRFLPPPYFPIPSAPVLSSIPVFRMRVPPLVRDFSPSLSLLPLVPYYPRLPFFSFSAYVYLCARRLVPHPPHASFFSRSQAPIAFLLHGSPNADSAAVVVIAS